MKFDGDPIPFPRSYYPKPQLAPRLVPVTPEFNIGLTNESAHGIISLSEKRRQKMIGLRLRLLIESFAVGVVASGADELLARYLAQGTQSENDQYFGPIIFSTITFVGFLSAVNRR